MIPEKVCRPTRKIGRGLKRLFPEYCRVKTSRNGVGMYGSFSETALKDFYDFTRCVRPNGTVYGTRGKCRKGVEQKADNKDSRKERRDKILAQIEHHKDSPPNTLRGGNIETLSNLVKNEPGFRSPLTESTLKALRFLRLKDHLDSSKAKKEGEVSLETEMRELLRSSPILTRTHERNLPSIGAPSNSWFPLLYHRFQQTWPMLRAIEKETFRCTRGGRKRFPSYHGPVHKIGRNGRRRS